jgi:hypothetical protein
VNNPHPFIVIVDDPVCDDPDQMAKIIAAALQDKGRFVVASYIKRTEEVPPGVLAVPTR